MSTLELSTRSETYSRSRGRKFRCLKRHTCLFLLKNVQYTIWSEVYPLVQHQQLFVVMSGVDCCLQSASCLRKMPAKRWREEQTISYYGLFIFTEIWNFHRLSKESLSGYFGWTAFSSDAAWVVTGVIYTLVYVVMLRQKMMFYELENFVTYFL